mgnify:CR=1 FL=1
MDRPPVDRSQIHFAVPGSIQRKTGGYGYDRRLIKGLRNRGRDVRLHELEGRFPLTDASALSAATDLIDSAPDGATLIIDGLALPAFESQIERAGSRLCIIALVHHLLADETSLDSADRRALGVVETQCLVALRHVIVTSPATVISVLRIGVPHENISVVEPGTDSVPSTMIPEHALTGPMQLLSVGALIPRKGHRILIRALAACRALEWRLTIAGSLSADSTTTADIRALIDREGLTDRIHLAGEIDALRLHDEYRRADLFVLASEFEGYGMAFAEALAHGLPIVGSGAGAVADTVPKECGLLVPVGDTAALTTALEQLMTDAPLRRRLAAGAVRAGTRLPSWETTVTKFDAALDAALDAAVTAPAVTV